MKLRTIVLTLVTLLAACAAHAADARAAREVDARALRIDGPLVAGQEVTVSWDGLPAGTEEFELLLACDEPVPLTIRLTESMDPELTAYAWRVPHVACDVARLQLRAGIDEREVVWAASAPFRITASTEGAPDAVREHGGELWMEDDAPAEWHGLPARFEGTGDGDAAEATSAAPTTDRASATSVARAHVDETYVRVTAGVAPARSRSPQNRPLRI